MKQLTFEVPVKPVEVNAVSEFITWANELNMLSPLMNTPSPFRDVEDSPPANKRPRWNLQKMDTPPRPTRPREPADNVSRGDPRIIYLPIILLVCIP